MGKCLEIGIANHLVVIIMLGRYNNFYINNGDKCVGSLPLVITNDGDKKITRFDEMCRASRVQHSFIDWKTTAAPRLFCCCHRWASKTPFVPRYVFAFRSRSPRPVSSAAVRSPEVATVLIIIIITSPWLFDDCVRRRYYYNIIVDRYF